MGINIGETKVLVYVQTLMGKKYSINPDGKLNLEKQFTTNVSYYPLQVVVYNIKSFDGYQNIGKEIEHIFPKNSVCFTLTNPYYGSRGVVSLIPIIIYLFRNFLFKHNTYKIILHAIYTNKLQTLPHKYFKIL